MKYTFLSLIIFWSLNLAAQTFTLIEDLESIGLGEVRNNNAVSVADYDQDGDLDVFFTGYYSFDAEDGGTWNRLMQNDGDGTFTDVTLAAGFTNQFVNTEITASLGEKMGASWGDYDNDGYPDLFLTNSRKDQLYHNNGDGTFTDVTQKAGVEGCQECYSGGATWFDHDRDGDLDLYVSILNGPNFLYQNEGDGTFLNATYYEGVAGEGVTWTTLALDVGKDGFIDLYCANDTQINEFFENRSGQRYNEASRAYRIADEGAGMGMTVGDYNNDGFFDVYVTNIYNHQPNPLFTNLGNRRFQNDAVALGVENTGWGWGTQFFDYDHDGDEDLAAVNGVVSKQYVQGAEQMDVKNYFFKNTLIENGVAGFTDWSEPTKTNGDERARGLEVFDYDGDGDLDMLVANVEAAPYLYRNETVEEKSEGKNWLQVQLEGTVANRSAYGTEVKITVGGQSYYRWHHGTGFFCQSLKPVHFGVGEAEMIDEIQVTWLSGEVEIFTNIDVNQLIKIKEGGELTDIETVLPSSQVEVSIAPNPFTANTNFQIYPKKSEELHLKIYSSIGTLIFEQRQTVAAGKTDVAWNANNLPSGIYFYQIELGDQQKSGQLMKK